MRLAPLTSHVLLEHAELKNMDDERKTLVGLGGLVALAGTAIAIALVINALIG